MKTQHKFPYKWYLKDKYPTPGIDHHKLKVFSTFACGGGSSMGYKLAGFDVVGANDIDPKMAEVYKQNHNPKHYFLCPIKDLLNKDLPKELYNLDILDGSPPCSTFSMSGSREKAFKKEKKFREGQAKQVLSDLFFDFLDLANKLQPKIIIAENVKGIILGNAKAYTKQILKHFDQIGYNCQLFCLNAASMGVPQKRERVFFIAYRKDLNKPNIKMFFNEKCITLKNIEQNGFNKFSKPTPPAYAAYWSKCKKGESISMVHPTSSFFNIIKLNDNEPFPTIMTKRANFIHYEKPYQVSNETLILCGSYPLDYDFLKNDPCYLIGMSVPPVMMAQIAHQVYLQWFQT